MPKKSILISSQLNSTNSATVPSTPSQTTTSLAQQGYIKKSGCGCGMK